MSQDDEIAELRQRLDDLLKLISMGDELRRSMIETIKGMQLAQQLTTLALKELKAEVKTIKNARRHPWEIF